MIKEATFVMSNEDYRKCPDHKLPEYAFIGRSNVGKSSLINMLTNKKKLAKTSTNPGKTLLINHFLIDQSWYLVDLPGYGYAKIAKSKRSKLKSIIESYISKRTHLTQLFILLDIRHKPMDIDIEFINWCGQNNIPLGLIFTKADKLKPSELEANLEAFKEYLLKYWDELPSLFVTSAMNTLGRDDFLAYIEQTNADIKSNFK
ncbi:MAG: YihA family ribosome biogenesis GTP-binding protein [Salinivirgaceae bacterium]|nr:MAG: YihA family ribosome biogenesis GTP-binding protein [Salinivirgaceae bacterium]